MKVKADCNLGLIQRNARRLARSLTVQPFIANQFEMSAKVETNDQTDQSLRGVSKAHCRDDNLDINASHLELRLVFQPVSITIIRPAVHLHLVQSLAETLAGTDSNNLHSLWNY